MRSLQMYQMSYLGEIFIYRKEMNFTFRSSQLYYILYPTLHPQKGVNLNG